MELQGLSDRFYQLVNRTCVSHVCTHEEVIEVCSRWFITERRGMNELPRLLEVYGELRDLGHDHEEVLRSLTALLRSPIPATAPNVATSVTALPIAHEEVTSRLNNLGEYLREAEGAVRQKMVDEDMRLIRNE